MSVCFAVWMCRIRKLIKLRIFFIKYIFLLLCDDMWAAFFIIIYFICLFFRKQLDTPLLSFQYPAKQFL